MVHPALGFLSSPPPPTESVPEPKQVHRDELKPLCASLCKTPPSSKVLRSPPQLLKTDKLPQLCLSEHMVEAWLASRKLDAIVFQANELDSIIRS